MFWIGLVVGMFLGAFFMALIAASRIGDDKTRAAIAIIKNTNSPVEDNK